MDLMNGNGLSTEDLQELGWDVKNTDPDSFEEFEPTMSFPVVMYHGSLKEEWGMYYVGNTRTHTLFSLNLADGSDREVTLRQVSRSSVKTTKLWYIPKTGEIR